MQKTSSQIADDVLYKLGAKDEKPDFLQTLVETPGRIIRKARGTDYISPTKKEKKKKGDNPPPSPKDVALAVASTPRRIVHKSMGGLQYAAETPGRLLKSYRKQEREKTSSQIAEAVLIKVGFAVTDEGHEYDADMAEIRKKYFLDQARRMQEDNTVGAYNEEGDNEASILKALRYNLSSPNFEGHPIAAARKQQYIQNQHEAGENAWNPFGGALTPVPEEGERGTPGFLGSYGKIE